MTYTSIFQSLTRSKWRWPLVPFAAVALFVIFTAVCVVDVVVGAAFLALMLGSVVLLILACLFDPALHAALRKRFTTWISDAVKAFARHPKIVATLRNPRWWVALPAWIVVTPPLIAWAIVRALCSIVAEAIRITDEKLHSLADAGVLRHMRRMYSWVFGVKA